MDKQRAEVTALYKEKQAEYQLKEPWTAFVRDVFALANIGAVEIFNEKQKMRGSGPRVVVAIRLSWPTEITETEFFEKAKQMPRSKNFNQLNS